MIATTGSVHGENRLPALDGLRGLAILLVMEFHFWGTAFAIAGQVPTVSIDIWTSRLIGLGWSGVDLFFVLSGFLITGILCDTKQSHGYLRIFYMRRFLRLAPVYYLFLLFVMLIVPFIGPIDAVAEVGKLRDIQWWMWTYTVNIGNSVKPFDALLLPLVYAPFWSLAVEEQFYLVWPFTVLALPRRPLMALCCVMVAAAFAIRMVMTGGYYDDVFGGNAASVLTPARMDTLALGALIALAARGKELRLLARAAPAVAALAIALLAVLFIKNTGLSPGMKDNDRLGYSAFAFLFAALLVIVVQAQEGSLLHRGLTLAPLQAFGKYSYAMYVFHLLTAFVLARAFILNDLTPKLHGSFIPLNIIFSATATLTTFALAWISWQLVEQPLLQLKKRLPYGERSSPSGATAAATEGV